jgi:Protein of unknown function (DUF2917)
LDHGLPDNEDRHMQTRRLMMNAQTLPNHSRILELRLAPGRPTFIGQGAGELSVLDGRVWLTRGGDLDDHVLARGDRVDIDWAERAVVESWERDRSATLQWRPIERRAPNQALAGALRGLAALAGAAAFVLARAEAGFAALARSAASSARRAQGCINAGDSMASSGALK